MDDITSEDPGCLEKSYTRRLHVLPLGDTHIHSAQKICWCHPLELDDKIVWQHNAKDCRDAKERVHGENPGDPWIIIAEYVPPVPAEVGDPLDELCTKILSLGAMGGCSGGTNQITATEMKTKLIPFFGEERIRRCISTLLQDGLG